MPAPAPAFPFPAANSSFTRPADVIFETGVDPEDPVYQVMYDKARGDAAKLLRLKYLAVEEELERAYRYVAPVPANAAVCSLKFGSIIRDAACVYEAQSKRLYAAFYNDRDRLDIYNYLALDRFLGLGSRRVVHLMAVGDFPAHPEVHQPFVKLAGWDKNSAVLPGHKPDWWASYNAVKHDHDGVEASATLANATAAVAALFLLIQTIFGFRVLTGGSYLLPRRPAVKVPGKSTVHLPRYMPRWARLFDTEP